MLNKILFIFLVLFALNHRNNLYEGTISSNKRDICVLPGETSSNIKLHMIDERCGSNHKPRILKNCIGAEDKFAKDNTCRLCNNGEYGKCRPTFRGGFCEKKGNKTDAYGEKLEMTGRDITNMSEEEIRNLNEEEYDKIKNECNSFYNVDDDPEDNMDYEEDEDMDRLDRRYRNRNRRLHRRDRRERRRDRRRDRREDRSEYSDEDVLEEISEETRREERRNTEDKGHYHIQDIFAFVGIFVGIFILVCILLIFLSDFILQKTGVDLSFFRSIKSKLLSKLKKKEKMEVVIEEN